MSQRVIIDEIEVDVNYGKLAIKTWNEDTDESKRVLLLHGWMDNSGSFDKLAPLLKHEDGLYLVALDLPGHGKSSQLPKGISYCDMTMILEMRRCLHELNWTKSSERDNESGNARKFSIIGHSLGAGLGLFYASLFPDEVEEVIMLDFLKSKTISPMDGLSDLARSLDLFIETTSSKNGQFDRNSIYNKRDSDKGQVTVSQEAAIVATIEAHNQLGKLSREDASLLLKRSTVPVNTPPNSVIFSRDLRLQCMLNIRDNWDLSRVLFSGLKCRVISILAKNGLYVSDDQFKDHFDDMIEYLKARCEHFDLEWLEGDHYLHMNNANMTASLINSYLKQ